MELKDQAMKSFEESKKKRVTTIMDGDGGGKQMVKVEESAGDAAFLAVAKNSLVEQAKLLGLNEIKPVENQDNSYKKFLKDLSSTIEKEKESKATDERRSNSLLASAETISFDPEPEKEPLPETMPLETINHDDY